MAVLASDTFTRANNADLGTAWDVQTGQAAFSLTSNAATPSSTTADCGETYNGVTWPNDQYSQAKVSMTGGTSGVGPGVACRCSSSAHTLYRAVVCGAATNNIELAKFVTGTYTMVTQRTQTWTNGTVLRLEVQGSSLRIYAGGTQLGATVTDAAIASGRAGINYSSELGAPILDDWEGGDFTTTVSPQHTTYTYCQAVSRAATR